MIQLLRKSVLLTAASLLYFSCLTAAPTRLKSPDGRWQIDIESEPALSISLSGTEGKKLLTQKIGMKLKDSVALDGKGATPTVTTRTVDETVKPTIAVKSATIRNNFNEAVLDFGAKYAVVVRAYDNGFAYRFVTKVDGDVIVSEETQENTFSGDPIVYFGHEKGFYSHTEVSYDRKALSQLEGGALASLPLLVKFEAAGPVLVFSETALESYPGQWMKVAKGSKGLSGTWPTLPTAEEETSDRDIQVKSRSDDLAKTSGKRSFPWRFVAIGATDGELLTNQLSYVLAEPSRVADTSWIKPGKAQWDWWHDFNVFDVPFRGGVSQALYLHYIDFASEHGANYVILDEGWYVLGDLTKNAGDIDVPALVKHGASKGVSIILWASWSTLKKQFDTVMPLFEKWGVAGLKVDFFQRDDQPAIDFYWKLAADAAKRKLLVDVHGAHKPAGLQRTYPNVLTFEGVKGLENNKWSTDVTPTHDTTLPFIRQVAGPMDYTPGAMDNAQKDQFRMVNRRPMSQGTRVHQLALYVVFESPLQMYADSPSMYRREPKSFRFMEEVPVTWDETRVLVGEIGKVVGVARRSGKRWFVGVLNGEEAREVTLDLSFISKRGVKAQIWRDGPNADRDGRDFIYEEASLEVGKSVTVKLAPGGGWTAILPAK